MGHVVLLGDSIFDNATYVPNQPDVIQQVHRRLPDGWQATLLALDGAGTNDVLLQIDVIPQDATHLVLSAGRADSFGASRTLRGAFGNAGESHGRLSDVTGLFRACYVNLLCTLVSLDKPLAVCTIYDSIPKLALAERAGLVAFNDVITRAAFAAGVPLIDLRLVCDQPEDYSRLSPQELSVVGGDKVAGAIADVVTGHDFTKNRSAVWI